MSDILLDPIQISGLNPIVSIASTNVFAVDDASEETWKVSISQLTTYLEGFMLPLAGGTMAGNINLNGNLLNDVGNPVLSTDGANKNYVDTVAAGLNPIAGAYAASTANLTSWTYSNGVAGVGATLTAPSTGVFTVDGQTPPVGSRFLYKNDTTGSGAYNGIYTVTTSSSGSNAVLTRATDYDTPGQIGVGDLIAVENGTVNGGASFFQTATVVTIGTSPISFSTFFSPANYLASTNPKIVSGNLLDSNGNIILGISPTASAVNYIQTENAVTTASPAMMATGSDTNVAMALLAKGTSGINIQGYTDGSDAASPYVGQHLVSNIAFGSAISLTSGSAKTITSIILTTGDWDVWGSGGANCATAGINPMITGISLTNNTLPDQSLVGISSNVGAAQTYAAAAAPSQRISVSSSTATVYLVVSATVSTGTLTGFGNIEARRRR